MNLTKGAAFSFLGFVNNEAGNLAAPDALPTGYAVRNGIIDNAFIVNVALLATGIYSFSGSVPIGYVNGDIVYVVMSAAVAGIQLADAVGEIQVIPSLSLGRCTYNETTKVFQVYEDNGVTPYGPPITLTISENGNITVK